MLRLQMQDARPGDYETLADKHITDISTFRETMEEQTGDLMMADVALTVNDKSRKFRDCILLNPPIKFKEDRVQIHNR